MAIIAFAAVKLARLTKDRDVRLWVISGVILVATAVTGAEIALLFIAAGLVMLVWDAPPRFVKRLSGRSNLMLLAAAAPPLHCGHGDGDRGDAPCPWPVLPQGRRVHLRERPRHRAVPPRGRGRATQLGDRAAVPRRGGDGLITPGPVVITAAFIGYLVGGFAGAALATVAIFTPIYLGVVIPGGWFIRHQDNAQVRAFVKGATAAAAGAIGGATIVLTRGAVVDLRTLGILLVSLIFVWRFKNKEPLLVVLAAAAGIALKGL